MSPARGPLEPRAPDPRTQRLAALALFQVVVLGAALRFFELDAASVWLDETSSLKYSRSLALALERVFHPPLYYLSLHFWTELFGTSAYGLRSLSAVIGTLLILASYRLALRLLGRVDGALLTALFVGVLPAALYFSREARMYSLWMLWVVSALWALLAASEGALCWPRIAAFWGATAAGMLTHHYMAFFVLANALCAFLLVGERALRKRRADLGRWALLHAPVGAVALLVLLRLAASNPRGGALAYLEKHALRDDVGLARFALERLIFFENWMYEQPTEHTPLVAGALLLVTAAASVALLVRAGAARRQRIVLVVSAWLPFLLIVYLPVRTYTRLLSASLPLLAMLLACFCLLPLAASQRLSGRSSSPRALTLAGGLTSAALVVGLLAALGPHLVHVYTREIEPWKQVCDLVQRRSEGRAIVFVTARYMAKGYAYCHEGEGPVVGFPDERLAIRAEDVPALAAGFDEVWLVYARLNDSRKSDGEGVALRALSPRAPLMERFDLPPRMQVFRFGPVGPADDEERGP
jgi:4-amino-4-deoxy-L-arabinose transferase-like glycosyltransferase